MPVIVVVVLCHMQTATDHVILIIYKLIHYIIIKLSLIKTGGSESRPQKVELTRAHT